MTSHGARWINSHSQKKDCKEAHKEEFIEFMRMKAIPKYIGSTHPSSSVSELWDKLKAKSAYNALCLEVELNDKENYDMDSDNEEEYIFDHAKGIMKLFASASEYKKQYERINLAFITYKTQQEQKINELEKTIENLTK